MKKVIVKNLQGIETFSALMEEPTQWIADCVASKVFGEPEKIEIDDQGGEVVIPSNYTIEIVDITAEFELQKCIQNRKSEYPTMEEFMNAYFDGGEIAVQALQNKRLQVKAKYPKP
jgi:hypothetical protein